MIKANELRIGNKIKRKSNGSICTVNWGIIKDFDLCQQVSDYEPIPLTPEILEKCGFKKDSDDCFLLRNVLYYIGERLHIAIGYSTAIICPCKYLHQLQNLYFALYNDELTINF